MWKQDEMITQYGFPLEADEVDAQNFLNVIADIGRTVDELRNGFPDPADGVSVHVAMVVEPMGGVDHLVFRIRQTHDVESIEGTA